jgi:protein SCO1
MTRQIPLSWNAVLFFLLLVLSVAVHAYDPSLTERRKNELPAKLQNIGITERIEQTLSGDIELMNEAGEVVRLESFFGTQKPVILSLIYFSCPSLCNIHLNGLMQTLGEIPLEPGIDYEFLAVSFEPNDTPDLAAAKKATYIKEYGRPGFEKGVHFLTATAEQIKRLTEQVGFSYAWDEEESQWSHSSAAIMVTPQKKISRYLHGIIFDPRTTRLSIVETSQGKSGSLMDQVALFCFNFDPKENRYALAAFNVMRLGAGATVVVLALWLLPFWLRNRKKAQERAV